MSTVRTPADLGAAIRAARRLLDLTQAELAQRAGVSRQWLVAVEQGHGRAELGKVNAVLHAVGLTFSTRPRQVSDAHQDRTWLTAADAAEVIRTEAAKGDTNFALRTLARAVSDLRRLADPADAELFLAEPPSTGDPRWDTLLAAAVSRECRDLGIDPPQWTRTQPLPSWWFPVFDPVLAARTMQRTPIDFAARGIWLDSRALEAA